MEEPPRTRYVSATELRRIFNELRLAEAVAAGKLSIRLRKDKDPSPPAASEPLCTRSQAVAYLDDQGSRVAVVHQFLRQDGSLGASGRPDPKMVLHRGEILKVEQPDKG